MFSKSNFKFVLKLVVSIGLVVVISALFALDFKKTKEIDLDCSLEHKSERFCNYSCGFDVNTNKTSKYDLVVNYAGWAAVEHISNNFSGSETVNFSLPRRENSYLLLVSFYNSEEKGVESSWVYC